MRRAVLPALLALSIVAVGCARQAPGSGETGAAAGDSDSAETGDPTSAWTPPAPSFDAAGVEAHLRAVLGYDLPDPASLLAAFLDIVAVGGTEGCPNIRDYNMNAPINGCQAPSGYLFAGLVIFAPVEGAADSFELSGDAYVTDPQQLTFQLAGHVVQAVDGDAWALEWDGTWGYPLADGWLAGVPSSALRLAGDTAATTLFGGYGIGGDAAYFRDVTVDATGATTGELWLRDPGGAWYVLTFAGGEDGCGEVTYAGEALGTACVPLAPAVGDVATRIRGGA